MYVPSLYLFILISPEIIFLAQMSQQSSTLGSLGHTWRVKHYNHGLGNEFELDGYPE
jgi:hypothetical protein